jgi:hypothetical protein
MAALLGTVVVSHVVGREGSDDDDSLAVSGLILANTRDLGGGLVEDTYRGVLTHRGRAGAADFARVTARLEHPFKLSHPGPFEILDADLQFGTVRAGQTVESLDTFAVRRRRHPPLTANQLRWSISARRDLVVPDAWAGEWRFQITARDTSTNQIAAVGDITDVIGIGEPVGFSLLPRFVRCRWTGSDVLIEARCSVHARVAACLTDGSALFTIAREGDDRISGRGDIHVVNGDGCGAAAGNGDESIDIAGVRQRRTVMAEPLSPGLLTSFGFEPGLVTLLAHGIADTSQPSDRESEQRDDDRREKGRGR